jgi:hypothetical protein
MLSASTHADREQPEKALRAEVQRILSLSEAPLTPAKILDRLEGNARKVAPAALHACLLRLVAADVVHLFPPYRGRHERFWDRCMKAHVAWLLRNLLEKGPLGLQEIRRSLPLYATTHADLVLREQVGQGLIHRLPPATRRGRERFSLQPADVRLYLRERLTRLFQEMQQLGFLENQLRMGAIAVLQEEEWGSISDKSWERTRARPAYLVGKDASSVLASTQIGRG